MVLKTRLIISSGKPLICICLCKSHFPDSLNDLVDFRLNGHTTYASRVSVKKPVLNASKCVSSDWRRRGTESTADYIMSVCRCQRGDDSRSLNTASYTTYHPQSGIATSEVYPGDTGLTAACSRGCSCEDDDIHIYLIVDGFELQF